MNFSDINYVENENITAYKQKSFLYTFDYLTKYCLDNNIILINNYEKDNINCHTIIEGKCQNISCDKFFKKKFYKLVKTNAYCKECIYINAKEKRKQTNLKTIGNENYFQNDLIKEKIKQTNYIKYGVSHITKSDIIKDKIRQTNLIKYGYTHQSFNQDIQKKITETNIKKYGVKHLMHKPEHCEYILSKAYKYKEYVFPSGNNIKYQGYENLALDELIYIEKLNENDIIVGMKNVPKIIYTDENNKERYHFVDIYIPSQNRCIEVKSTWTFKKKNVILKQKSAKQKGYNYEIWVYDKKGNKVIY